MQQIVILGGGAAGLAAALASAQSAPAGAVRVTVLDRNPRCGKKLLATGNGRCNLDNTAIAPEKYFTADPAAHDRKASGHPHIAQKFPLHLSQCKGKMRKWYITNLLEVE